MESTEQNQPDAPGIDNTESSELQLNHKNCESRDDESETENTLSLNMLHIIEEYKTPNESNYYHNHETFVNFYEQNKTHNLTDYNKQEI